MAEFQIFVFLFFELKLCFSKKLQMLLEHKFCKNISIRIFSNPFLNAFFSVSLPEFFDFIIAFSNINMKVPTKNGIRNF